MTSAPLGYLATDGAAASPVTALAWGLVCVSLAVILIVCLLVVWASLRRRGAPSRKEADDNLVGRPASGLGWIYGGLTISVPVLLISTVWSLVVLAQVMKPAASPGLTIEVNAHQWWWEARYDSPDPWRIFTTANEIHIPVGVPVQIKLASSDVIHSFWAPKLAGKMDVIPGLANATWIEADQAGRYRGQCGEYCGLQHARMAFYVVAESPAAFAAWRARQLRPPDAHPSPVAARGAAVFAARCAACHTIRGAEGGGIVGPDLSHLADRETLAGAMIPNDRSHLDGWIRDPQSVKPGALMPAVRLTQADRGSVVAYLESLK